MKKLYVDGADVLDRRSMGRRLRRRRGLYQLLFLGEPRARQVRECTKALLDRVGKFKDDGAHSD